MDTTLPFHGKYIIFLDDRKRHTVVSNSQYGGNTLIDLWHKWFKTPIFGSHFRELPGGFVLALLRLGKCQIDGVFCFEFITTIHAQYNRIQYLWIYPFFIPIFSISGFSSISIVVTNRAECLPEISMLVNEMHEFFICQKSNKILMWVWAMVLFINVKWTIKNRV